MLATVRLGAIHSVVFGGFAAASLAARIDDARPKVMVTSDAGMRMGKMIALKPLVDESIRLAQAPAAARDRRRPRARQVDDARRRAATSTTPPLREKHAGAKVPVDLARVQRALVHPLHERHDRPAQGRAARHRRLRRGARRLDAPHLLLEAGRGVLLHLRHRLGGGPLVHRLRAAHQRLDHDHVRGRADAPRRGRLVEDRAGLQGDVDVLVAHRDPRAEEAGPGVDEEVRHLEPALPVPRRRAARRAHRALGRASRSAARSSTTTGRPRSGWPILTACPGIEDTPRKFGSPSFAGVRLPREAQARGDRRGGRRQREGRAVHRAAAAAGRDDHDLGRRRSATSRPTTSRSPTRWSTPRSTGRRATRTATTSCSGAPTT